MTRRFLRCLGGGRCLSHGAQTFPADRTYGVLVTTRERAEELSMDPEIDIQIVS